MSTSSSTTGSTLGKIFAGIFLHEFRDGGKTAPQMIQVGLAKLKKYVGKQEAQAILEATDDAHRVTVCALIDYVVLDKLTPESEESMAKLPTDQRILVEAFVLKATGRNFVDRSDEGRWAQPLWNARSICHRYMDLSPTQVAPEELLQALKDVIIPMLTTLREHVKKNL